MYITFPRPQRWKIKPGSKLRSAELTLLLTAGKAALTGDEDGTKVHKEMESHMLSN